MMTNGSTPSLETALLLMAYFWNSKINHVLRPSVPNFVVFVLVEGNGSGIGRKNIGYDPQNIFSSILVLKALRYEN